MPELKGCLADSHTHCRHSHDTDYRPEAMLERAARLGACYYAFTDHDDRDYLYTLKEYGSMRQLDVKGHVDEIIGLRDKYKDKIYAALGIELSYAPRAVKNYIDDLSVTDEWDVVLNSVHTVDGHDVYYQSYFDCYGREKAYTRYLECVSESLDAPYSYDVLAHLGYVSRKAPYGENNALTYREFPKLIDEILIKLIEKGASLELNTHTKFSGGDFLPDISIVMRYIELGGTEFTFGSDAHQDYRVLDKFDIVKSALKGLGADHINAYVKREKTALKL